MPTGADRQVGSYRGVINVCVQAAPTTAATMAVTGRPSGVCTAAKVTMAVIVPGPAANMMSGASGFSIVVRRRRLADRVAAAKHVEPHMIIPPTIRNTSSEMLKMLRTCG